jgi:hypothetical protein
MSNVFSNSFSQLQSQGVGTFNAIYSRLTIDNLVKYVIQGLAVAIAAAVIPNRKTGHHEVAVIAIVSALTFFVLDIFTDDIGKNVRLGVGLGIGLNLVNLNTNIPYLAGIL